MYLKILKKKEFVYYSLKVAWPLSLSEALDKAWLIIFIRFIGFVCCMVSKALRFYQQMHYTEKNLFIFMLSDQHYNGTRTETIRSVISSAVWPSSQLSPHTEEKRLPVSCGTKRQLKKEAVFQRAVRLSALIKWLSVMTSHNALIHRRKSLGSTGLHVRCSWLGLGCFECLWGLRLALMCT